jgi:serine/threonine protein kinase
MSTLNSISYLQGNKYKVESILGSGGFGNTYLAIQVALGRKVAIKEFFMKDYCDRDESTSQIIIPTESSRQIVEKYKQKFLKEAQMIASLKNEHIIQIYDIFEENNTAYYVMEYIDGGSLKDKVEHNGPMSECTSMTYIRQIAEALTYLHKHSILHLDIKPANILVDRGNRAILIDFGISKHYDSEGGQTSTTPAGVSKGYAPIEQYQQGSISGFTPSTDVYSLGATLYFLLTGETPPEASIVYEDGLPSKIATFTESVQHVISTSMSPRRKDRFQTMEEFTSALPDLTTDTKRDKEKNEHQVPSEETTIIVKESVKNETSKQDEKQNNTKSNKIKKPLLAIFVLFILIGGVAIFIGTKLNSSIESSKADVINYAESKITFDDGLNSKNLTFGSNGHNGKTLNIKKNFSEIVTASNVPDWVVYTYTNNLVIIQCRENTGKAREAIVYLHRKGDGWKYRCAQIKIKQYANSNQIAQKQDATSNHVTPKKETPVKYKASKLFMPNNETIEGEVGKTVYLKYEITPLEAKNNKVTWTSSNTSVATVNSDGAITAKSNGKTIITAIVDGVSRECNLEVRIKQSNNQTLIEEEMTLSKSYISLNVGESYTLIANNAGNSLVWESENPKIASVSSSGKVVAISQGKTTIWAKGKSYKMCTVNVTESNHNTYNTPPKSNQSSSITKDNPGLVSGKIVDSKGNPIVGAAILIKGTTIGTVTGVDGKYSITATADDIIVFSCKKYITQEKLVGNNPSINITMQKR